MSTDKKNPALVKPTPAEPKAENKNSQLRKLFTDALKDIYWAEQELVKTLPTMADAATTPELKAAIDEHLIETRNHVQRLEKIFGLCGEPVAAKKCEAMAGLVKEGKAVVED